MKNYFKLFLTIVGTVLTVGVLDINSSQAALLNFNLTFIENNTNKTTTGTFQIDDSIIVF